MLKYARYALMPVAAALVLAMAPAEAISLGAGTSASATQTASAQPQPLTRKQLKQQRKLQKKCAKLAAGKIKKAKKRAKYQKLCASPVAPSAQGQGDGGSGPVLDDEGADDETSTGGAGTPAGSGGSSNAGGSSPGGGGGSYVDEILDLPPVFTPPAGGQSSANGGLPQLPTPALDPLQPTQDVPEPGSLALLGLGLMGLGLARRRR